MQLLLSALLLITAVSARAGTNLLVAAPQPGTRYGLFDALDHRSSYGVGVFPEPFLVDDSDLEVNEFRLDWLSNRVPGRERDQRFTAELEKGFGNLTLEVEVHYHADSSRGFRLNGFDNLDLGARYPLFQAVSRSGFIDTTFGLAGEAGLPVDSGISRDTELVPKLFNDTKIGNFTLQTILGYSVRLGPDEDNHLRTFEYGIVAGYAIQRPLPGVEQFIPVFELSGEDPLNHGERGNHSLVGNLAFRINLRAIGRIQPRLGFGYVFPLTQAAQAGLQRGLFTSLVFDF